MLVVVTVAAAVVLLAASSAWSWWSYRQRTRRMRELAAILPGAPELPFIGHLHRFLGDREDIMTTLKEMSYLSMHQGGITKVWLGHFLFFILTDPLDMEYVLKTCLEKDDITQVFRAIIGNGILFAPVSAWRRRRRNIVPALRQLDPFVELFSRKSEALAAQIQSGDVFPFLSTYSLDVIFEALLGATSEARTRYLQVLVSIGELIRLAVERMFHPWLHSDWIYRLTRAHSDHKKHTHFVFGYADEAILNKRLQLEKEERCLQSGCHTETLGEEHTHTRGGTILSMLIAESKSEQSYSDLELREEMMCIVTAGTDTSAVGASFTLLLLARHQDVQERVYQELVDVYGNSDRRLVKEDLSKLCYLERVIKESLRLYPPVPFVSRKTHTEITLPSGRVLPAGCGIPISIWGAHRNPKYWGADAEEFDPERFAPERFESVSRQPCVYMPFSAGPRNCVGIQNALMSMKASISAVLRRYRLRVAGPAQKHIRVKFDIMLRAVDGYNIVLEPRTVSKDS